MDALSSAKTKLEHATGMALRVPEIAVIETTNRCNLRCLMCYRLEHLQEAGHMDFELFKQIAQWVKGARQVWCQGGGEPLLHPRIVEMIDYAYEVCHPEVLAIVTNGTVLSRAKAEMIAASRLTRLVVSMDGSDKQTYEDIRGFPFERVVENVHYSSPYPRYRP